MHIKTIGQTQLTEHQTNERLTLPVDNRAYFYMRSHLDATDEYQMHGTKTAIFFFAMICV